MEMLRRCPLAIAQWLVHCATAVSTAVLGQSHKDNAHCTAVEEQPEAKEVQLSQPSFTSLLMISSGLRDQLHLPPLDLAWNPVVMTHVGVCVWTKTCHVPSVKKGLSECRKVLCQVTLFYIKNNRNLDAGTPRGKQAGRHTTLTLGGSSMRWMPAWPFMVAIIFRWLSMHSVTVFLIRFSSSCSMVIMLKVGKKSGQNVMLHELTSARFTRAGSFLTCENYSWQW